MRQSSKRVPDSAEKTSGIFAEPAEDKIRIVLEGLRGEDSIAEARKGSIRTSTAVGRRSSWRQARNSSPATRRARRPRTRSRNSRLRLSSSRRRWPRTECYRNAPRTLTSTCLDPFECPQFALRERGSP